MLRIQSTHLEQKRFDDVLLTVGADLYYNLAVGAPIVVHDVSERPRVTRALWQGMAWIRYASERLWGLQQHETTTPVMRNGHNATRYFESVLDALNPRTKTYVGYYSRYWLGQNLEYTVCAAGRRIHYPARQKELTPCG
jgi:hypothetical protein